MKEIVLPNGEVSLVSDHRYDYYNQWNWTKNNKNYVKRGARIDGKDITIFLHKEIAKQIGLDLTHQIDHKDRNPLNNQDDNLRAATRSQNQHNSGKYRNNTSGYKGVCWDKRKNKWKALIRINGYLLYLGHFDVVIEAAKAYDKAAKRWHGEFAVLNFPEELL